MAIFDSAVAEGAALSLRAALSWWCPDLFIILSEIPCQFAHDCV